MISTITSLIHCMFLFQINRVSSHGRLMEPPNRSSLWRFPEFAKENPPINYDDNRLYCGGFAMHHQFNGGKCGLCGDEYNMTRPRANENKGEYGKGIISRRYKTGQEFSAKVELTFSHLGYFEFRLCKIERPTETEAEECFDQYLLPLADGSGTRFYVPDSGENYWYTISLKFPENLSCEHCVLQWHYNAGNSWGDCHNGTSTIGCGPQETFRGCSDITIL